jgi:hypothetical protein
MKTRQSLLGAAALAAALAFTSHANAAPASRASLESLFQLIHVDSMIDNVYASMQRTMSQTFAQDAKDRGASPARQRIEAKAMEDSMALVRKEYNWSVMEPEILDAYQKTFTEEEVTAMINFYATPAGQATVTKMPQLTQAMMASTQAHMQALLPQIRAISEKARADADVADKGH